MSKWAFCAYRVQIMCWWNFYFPFQTGSDVTTRVAPQKCFSLIRSWELKVDNGDLEVENTKLTFPICPVPGYTSSLPDSQLQSTLIFHIHLSSCLLLSLEAPINFWGSWSQTMPPETFQFIFSWEPCSNCGGSTDFSYEQDLFLWLICQHGIKYV